MFPMAMCMLWIGRSFQFPTDVGNGTLQSPHLPKKKRKEKGDSNGTKQEKKTILKKRKNNYSKKSNEK